MKKKIVFYHLCSTSFVPCGYGNINGNDQTRRGLITVRQLHSDGPEISKAHTSVTMPATSVYNIGV